MGDSCSLKGLALPLNAVLYASLCTTLQPINITNIPFSSPPPISLYFSSLQTALRCCSVSTPASSAHKKVELTGAGEPSQGYKREDEVGVGGLITQLWLDNS